MKIRSILLSSTLVLSLAGAGLWLFARGGLISASTRASLESKSDAAGAASAHALAAISRRGFEPGVEYVHEIQYRMRFGPSGQRAAASPQLEFQINGRWKSTVVESLPDGVSVRAEFLEPKLVSEGHAPNPAISAIEGSLGRPIFVDLDTHGRALRAYATAGMNATALGVLRDIVTASQFTTPEEPASRWIATELDPAGEYQAEYRLRSDGLFARKKTGYLRLAGQKGLSDVGKAPAPVLRAYAAEFALDDWGRVSRTTSSVDVATPLMGDSPEFESQTRVELRFVSRTLRTGALPKRTSDFISTSLTLDGSDFANAAASADRSTVNGESFEQILSGLDGLKAGDFQAASAVQHRLAALFRLDKSAIAKALRALDANNASIILGALGSAGTPEAQQALAGVASDEGRSLEQRKAAVDAMLSIEHPTSDTRKSLEALLSAKDPELKSNASYMLGIMSRRLGGDEPAEATAMVQRLTDNLASATNSEERVQALGALGNSGSPDALASISKSLESSDPAIRGASAAALRFVPDATADTLLAKVISSDPDSAVRRAALMAASYRAYEPLAPALEAAAKRDPEPTVRVATVATLATLAKDDSSSLLLLDWLAQNDPDSGVREQAKKALERGATL